MCTRVSPPDGATVKSARSFGIPQLRRPFTTLSQVDTTMRLMLWWRRPSPHGSVPGTNSNSRYGPQGESA